MVQDEFNTREWVDSLAMDLEILSESLTAFRYGNSGLSNSDYRSLAKEAFKNHTASTIFESFVPQLNSDATKVIEQLLCHPEVKKTLAKSADQGAIMLIQPYAASRAEWDRVALYLAKSTLKNGGKTTANYLREYLSLSAQNKLPGHDITLFRGLKVNDRIEIGGGAFIAPYEEIVEVGLIEEPVNRGLESDGCPDYGKMDAAALVMDFEWGPGIWPPMAGLDSGPNREFTYAYLERPLDTWIVFDLLAIASCHVIQVLSRGARGAIFMENLDPNFRFRLPPHYDSADYLWQSKTLNQPQTAQFLSMLCDWKNMGQKRDQLELAIRRLASATSRKGRFALQDGILDVSIALENFYKVGSIELSYKLAMRIAFYLGGEGRQKEEIYKIVKNFYAIRSSIVHGRKIEKESLQNAFSEAYEISQQTLLKALSIGLPENDKSWDKLILLD